jgi:hypothetical protein
VDRKEDVGGQSEQPDEGDRRKAAFSDALKRAAVKFGIGRYLYRQKPQWVDWDPLREKGLCQTFELIEFVKDELEGRLPGKMADWSDAEYPRVKEVVDAFVGECKEPATEAQRHALERWRAAAKRTLAEVNRLIGRDARRKLDEYTQRDYRRAALYLTANPGPENPGV